MSREVALHLLQQGHRFLVTCHRRPDADAFGSALGFAAILRELGKEALVFVPDPLALTIQFLATQGPWVTELDPSDRFDATWVMDTAAVELLPEPFPTKDVSGPCIVLDHHAAHDDVGDVVVRDTDASATGEVIMDLLPLMGLKEVPKGAATPLYAAIVADTGGFRYPGTSPKTLRYGAQLLEAGAEPWETAYELFEGWPEARLRLLGEVLKTIKTSHGGALATLRVTRKMLECTHANDDMVEGMVNYARMLRGVEVAALFWEWPTKDGLRIKLSLRSRGGVDISKIATAFGGGGHRGAAGAEIKLSMEEAMARVHALTGKLLAQ